MAICVVCGSENEKCLCDSCREHTDIEQLCQQILAYRPASGVNPIWDTLAESLMNLRNFKNIVFALSENLPTPRKEYVRVLCIADDREYVPKGSRSWLYDVYEKIQTADLTEDEINRIRGLVMSAYLADYRYQDADEIAAVLTGYDQLPHWCYLTVGDYYTKTRRYDEAEEILKEGLNRYDREEAVQGKIEKLLEANEVRRKARAGESNGKEYLPTKQNPEGRQRYIEFMSSIGIDVEEPAAKYPTPIPKDQYPAPIETRDADFDTFVAFDVETTGFNIKIDSMIEIGAIKVVNGEIIEEKEWMFQELVKPFKRRISEEITQLTGISQDNVQNAREMWEVTPDFLEFVGDLPLVGFNSIRFDSRVLARAGRYSNRIIRNRHFDVMRYAENFSDQLGLEPKKISLGQLSDALEIENPRAHRALADAITTAKIYLKLKDMESGKQEDVSIDDLLADLDNW